MIKPGDRRTVHPVTFDVYGENGKPRPISGIVVYIHPAARYCTLEFEVGRNGAKMRESFKLVEGEILE